MAILKSGGIIAKIPVKEYAEYGYYDYNITIKLDPVEFPDISDQSAGLPLAPTITIVARLFEDYKGINPETEEVIEVKSLIGTAELEIGGGLS